MRPALSLGALALLLLLPAAACTEPLRVPERVVFVTWDTTRADRIGAYGYAEANTPALDGLAAEGVLFEQAVSPVPTTLPAHSTMFTGLYPQDHKVRYNLQYRLNDEVETLAERLRDAGYSTAGFPASHILDRKYGIAQGFETWIDPPAMGGGGGQHPESIMRSAEQGVDDALEWLGENGDGKAFLWLHFYDPHYPYELPFPYDSEYRDRPYDGELAYTDAQFGRLLEELKADPGWENTLVVVAGDHGEGLHDHRERWHSLLVYESTQRVPLIVRQPGASSGRRVAEPVTIADLTPTILDLAGIANADEMRGVSLRGALGGGTPPPRDLYFESHAGALNYGWQKLEGLRFGDWKLITAGGSNELYDLKNDPGEQEDLSQLESSRLQELQSQLVKLGEPMGEFEEVAVDEELSPEARRQLASLGYTSGSSSTIVAGAPHPRDVVDLQIELLSAQSMVARGDWQRVLEFVDYVLERDARNKWALINRSTALYRQERTVEAEKAAFDALDAHSEDPATHGLMAQMLSANGKYNEALAILEAALAQQSFAGNPRLNYLRIVSAFEAGRDDVCEALVPDAVINFPNLPPIHVMKARCLVLEGNAEEALERLRLATGMGFRNLSAIEAAPDFAPVVALEAYAAFAEGVRSPETFSTEEPEEDAS